MSRRIPSAICPGNPPEFFPTMYSGISPEIILENSFYCSSKSCPSDFFQQFLQRFSPVFLSKLLQEFLHRFFQRLLFFIGSSWNCSLEEVSAKNNKEIPNRILGIISDEIPEGIHDRIYEKNVGKFLERTPKLFLRHRSDL